MRRAGVQGERAGMVPEGEKVGWAQRLRRGRAGVILLCALLLLGLAAAGQLSWPAALLALLLLLLAAGFTAGGQNEPVAGLGGTHEAGPDWAGFRALTDALAEPCLLLDRRAAVTHANLAARRAFPTLILGSPLALSLRHPDVIAAATAAGRNGTEHIVDFQQAVPTETWYRVRFAPLVRESTQWDEDPTALVLVTFDNVTERRRLDAMRQDFIANVSHELRTPLTALIGFIDTLLGPAARDEAARDRFLALMRGQAERMARLVEDLLSLSRIEMHQHVRPTGTVDLERLLREVSEGLQTLAREAGVEMALSLPEGPAPVTGDREELYEVFQNLLENAIKYGAEGKRVELELRPATDRPGFAFLVAVTDYGPGVDAQHVPRLTERFYRVDAEGSRKKKGTGLGLAIVKHIVTRHRGVLSIRSGQGEGMRAEILLPS